MKRIRIAAALFLAAAASAGAQTMYDGITFSQNNYLGTARSMALGNAVTAVGGDLGTIGINPAGSAVSNYGQFILSPGISRSSVSSAFSTFGPDEAVSDGIWKSSRAGFPNGGVSLNIETGSRRGLKSLAVAFVVNQTERYDYEARAAGRNGYSSKVAEFANAAYGYRESVLSEYNSYNNSDIPWDVLTAYQGGMFGSFGTDGLYAGVTEAISHNGSYQYLAGALHQVSNVTKTGSKNDMIFNLGMNFNDNLFVGFNIGVPYACYGYTESFTESAVNPDQFLLTFQTGQGDVDTYFNRASYSYCYAADMEGVYAKVGVIYLPSRNLRLGAAIQTPTILTITESWQHKASTSFVDSYFDDRQVSPAGEYTYTLRTPYIVNLGAAYTFGRRGFVSADYELMDYSVMKFASEDYYDYYYDNSDEFREVNITNGYFAGLSHSLRLGAELRLSPQLSLRAGYTVVTSPEKHWTDNFGDDIDANAFLGDFNAYYDNFKSLDSYSYYSDRTKSVSFGFGYSSKGSFFADFAAKRTVYPDSVFSPYYDYDGYNSRGQSIYIEAPKILNRRSLWNLTLTLGWRF